MSNGNKDRRAALPEGRYANVFRIGFNAQEFLLDFGQLRQGDGEDEGEQFFIRIISVPINVKRLLTLLQQSIESYEETFLSIPDPDAYRPPAGSSTETNGHRTRQGEPR